MIGTSVSATVFHPTTAASAVARAVDAGCAAGSSTDFDRPAAGGTDGWPKVFLPSPWPESSPERFGTFMDQR